jgi:ArsR family transcriptional regulator
MRRLAGMFRALADETRLQMMGMLLRRREICVCDFVEVLGITQSKASRHLRYLLHAGLVEDRRTGLWVHYRVADAPSPDARAAMLSLRTLLGDERMHELEARLARWLKRKRGRACVPCAAAPGRRRTRPRGGRR